MNDDDGSCYQLTEAHVDELRLEELRKVIKIQKAVGEPLGQPIDEYGRALDDNGNLLNGDGRWGRYRYNNTSCWSGLTANNINEQFYF